MTAANGTQKTPPPNGSMLSVAAWSARRVLPLPPGPVSVTTLAVATRSVIARSSSVRPTRASDGAGRLVALSERSGGNVIHPQLEEPFRCAQILEPMHPEVATLMLGRCEVSGVGQDDLAAVGRCADPGCSMDIETDITLVGQHRATRVDPDPDADRAAGVTDLGGRYHGVVGTSERDEERVALGVDLDAVVSGDGSAHQPPVLPEQ